MQKILLIVLVSGLAFGSYGQGVGIGTQEVASSALLELKSTTKGTLLTRMTSAQRKAISNPEAGLLVFDTDKHTLYMYDGQTWMPLLFATTESSLPPFGVTASDGQPGDNFGYSVAVSGNYAVIGALNDKIGNNSVQGSVYVFKKANGIWIQQAKLVASDGAAEDYFGSDVAIDGDYMVIGAPGKSVNGMQSAGGVYVFSRNGDQWTQQAILHASDADGGDHFGHAVAISNNYLIVGSPYNNIGSQADRGNAYVFSRSGDIWTQQAVINPPLGLTGDQIGKSVDIDENKVLIGAPGDDHNNQDNAGCAYMYKRIGNLWTGEFQFLPESSQANSFFGSSVAMDDTTAVIGWPQLDYSGYINLGAVSIYFFNGTTWYKHYTIAPPEQHENLSFGTKVDISNGTIVIGVPFQHIGSAYAQGKAWVYRQHGLQWHVVRPLADDDGASYDSFGYDVSVDGYEVIIGSYRKNDDTGKVFFVNLE